MSGTKPRGWTALGVTGGLLALTVWFLAISQPWFERRNPGMGSWRETYSPYKWGEDTTVSELQAPGDLMYAEIVLRREWGLAFMLATAAGAVLAFVAAKNRPDQPNGRRAALGSLILAAISAVLLGPMWHAYSSSALLPSDTTHVSHGFLIGAPATLGWLVIAIVVWRTAVRSRAEASVETAPGTAAAG